MAQEAERGAALHPVGGIDEANVGTATAEAGGVQEAAHRFLAEKGIEGGAFLAAERPELAPKRDPGLDVLQALAREVLAELEAEPLRDESGLSNKE